MNLCQCGCGEEVTNYKYKKRKFVHGHNGRGTNITEEHKNILRKFHTGRKHTKEHRRNNSKAGKKRMQDPVIRKAAIEGGRNVLKDPIKKKQHREAILKAVNDPKVKAKHIKAKRKTCTDPDYKLMRSELSSRLYLEGKMDKAGRGKKGFFFSKKNNKELHYRSSYELVAYELLEQMSKVKSYEVEPFSVQYEWKERRTKEKRYTIPDILITYTDGSKELVEVKPEYKLEDRKTKTKLEAMKDFANGKGWDFSIWTENELRIN